MSDNDRILTPNDNHNLGSHLMRMWLHSRIETGFESNEPRWDEDVNVYICGQLARAAATPHLPLLPSDLNEAVERAQGPLDRFRIYLKHGNHVLISTGIFGDGVFSRTTDALPTGSVKGLGRMSYLLACGQGEQVRSLRGSALMDVAQKLYRGFPRYWRILDHMRGEYMDLISQFSTGWLFHIEKNVGGSGSITDG